MEPLRPPPPKTSMSDDSKTFFRSKKDRLSASNGLYQDCEKSDRSRFTFCPKPSYQIGERVLYLSELSEIFLGQSLWSIPTKYRNRAKNKIFLKNLIWEGVLWKLGRSSKINDFLEFSHCKL